MEGLPLAKPIGRTRDATESSVFVYDSLFLVSNFWRFVRQCLVVTRLANGMSLVSSTSTSFTFSGVFNGRGSMPGTAVILGVLSGDWIGLEGNSMAYVSHSRSITNYVLVLADLQVGF